MSGSTHKRADLSRLKRERLANRASLVDSAQLAAIPSATDNIGDFRQKLPDILKARDFNLLVDRLASAKKRGRGIFWLLGAHVIKCGLSPIVIELMEKGWVSLVGFNGAGVIHDIELAFAGTTSEDVAANLHEGRFGMSEDTARWFADAVTCAADNDLGLGEGVGRYINQSNAANGELSIFAAAERLGVPAVVFPTIGAEIVAQHPEYDAARVGERAHIDFRVLASACSTLNDGGAVLHWGSAVVLPEVFLKALSVACNLGTVEDFTTANFDMIQHYRPNTNVVTRPTAHSGRGISITGHHEIMLPLLAWALAGAE